MEVEKQKLISELEKIGEVIFVKKFENQKDAFAYYFSILDINGVDSILSNQNNYDGITKLEYLNLIKEHFISLKNNNIFALTSVQHYTHVIFFRFAIARIIYILSN